MGLYLLDTDICSYIMKCSHPSLIEKLRSVSLAEIGISVITEAELLYGVELSAKPDLSRAAFDDFVKQVTVLDWSRSAACHYADIRANLKKRGELIGGNDMLIAAHARSLEATVVTNNVRDFSRVPGLVVENWAS
jgi:tRNA(fMet)-specific endonuclease VapC